MAALTTELAAINTMLSIIGEAPVNTVEDTGLVDAKLAKQILTETNRLVQMDGWSWNRDDNYPLVPAYPLPGRVYVPENTLKVDPVDNCMKLAQRGVALYDRTRHTFEFTETVYVNLVLLLDFELLPQAARHYIMIRAGRTFQDRVVGSSTLAGFNEKDELRALVALRNAEAEVANFSLLDNDIISNIMRR